jgi:hypothetical protein
VIVANRLVSEIFPADRNMFTAAAISSLLNGSSGKLAPLWANTAGEHTRKASNRHAGSRSVSVDFDLGQMRPWEFRFISSP